MQTIKIVVVGDNGVGKSCLILSYSTKSFPSSDCLPSICDNYYRDYTANDLPFRLHVFDTTGKEEYKHLRSLSYPLTDVFIVCFDISNRASFSNVKDVWVPELRQSMPEAPILLVATKIDLRSQNADNGLVLASEAQNLAKELRFEYVECSALAQEGVRNVFESAICETFCKCCMKRKKHGLFRRLFGFCFKKKPSRPLIQLYKPDD